MTRKKTAGIIRLEERVLFEAAAAPEIAALAAAEGQEGGDGNDGEDASSGSDNDNLEKTATEAALAAGPDGVAIGDDPVTGNEPVVAEGVGEEKGGDPADGTSSDEAGDADGDGESDPLQEALLPDPAEGLEIGNTDSVVDGTLVASADDLDLDDPSSIVIENDSSEVITVHTDSAAETAQTEPTAQEIAAEINANSEAAAEDSAEGAEHHELVIVNESTADLDVLLGEVEEGRDVLVLDSDSSDPMADIQSYMEAKDYTYDAVHIVTHGSDSGLLLGGNFVQDGSAFGVMKDFLSDDADILVYGCSTASTEQGQAFLQDIADATGADISASVDLTGASRFGGDWNLEYAIGDVTADSLTVSDAWDYRLATTICIDGKGGAGADGTAEHPFKDLYDYANGASVNLGGDVVVLLGTVEERANVITVTGNTRFASEDNSFHTYTFDGAMSVADGTNLTFGAKQKLNPSDPEEPYKGSVNLTGEGTLTVGTSGNSSAALMLVGMNTSGQEGLLNLSEVTVNGTLWNLNGNTIIVNEGGLTVNGTFWNGSSSTAGGLTSADAYTTLDGTGTVTVNGTMRNHGSIQGDLTIDVTGEFRNETGSGDCGKIRDNVTVNVTGNFYNAGTETLTPRVFGNASLFVSGTLENDGGSLENTVGIIVGNSETPGKFVNSGNGTVAETVTMTIFGDAENSSSETLARLYNVSGDVTNSGHIASVYEVSGDVTNSGHIASVYEVGGNVTNSGTIENAYNVSGDVTNGSTGTIDNLYEVGGNVTNEGTVGIAYSISGNVDNTATGVITDLLRDVKGDVTNSGTIGTAYNVTGDVDNSGYVDTLYDVYGSVTNSGTVTTVVHSVRGDLDNSGIVASAYGVDGDVTNSGTMGILYDVDGTVTNAASGTINELCFAVTAETNATGINVTTIDDAFSELDNAVSGGTSGSIVNQGTINAYGIAVSLNVYANSDNASFRSANGVVSAAEALTMTQSITLTQDTVFLSSNAADPAASGYEENKEATWESIVVGSGVTLALQTAFFRFDNVGITVDDGGVFSVESGAQAVFAGNQMKADYLFRSASAYEFTDSAHETAFIANAGTVTIDGAGTLASFSPEALETGSFGNVSSYDTAGIRNDGTNAVLTVTDSAAVAFSLGSGSENADARARNAYTVWNRHGSVNIKDATISMATYRDPSGVESSTAAVFNESSGNAAASLLADESLNVSAELANANIAALDAKITVTSYASSSENVYGIRNLGTAYLEDSFIVAEGKGSANVFGVQNEVSGVFEFNVAGDQFATQDALDNYFFTEKGVDWSDYADDKGALISDYILPGISGKNPSAAFRSSSVTNSGQLYVHYSGDFSADNESWVGSSSNYTYTDVPVLLLYGKVETIAGAEASSKLVLTDLDQVTIVGGTGASSLLSSDGTAMVQLKDVSVTSVSNEGSEFRVTGNFDKTSFSVRDGLTSLVDWTDGGDVEIDNISGTMKFGVAATQASANIFHAKYDDGVLFSKDLPYSFYNLANLSIENFDGLGSLEEHAVTLVNFGGDLTIDARNTHEVTERTENDGNMIMFVTGPYNSDDSQAQDGGIYNYMGALSFYSLDVLNTNAMSVAVTNQAGTLNMTKGALVGTYSGLDNIEAVNPSGGQFSVKVDQSTATLTDLTLVGGASYGIRNTGTLNMGASSDDSPETLITNDLYYYSDNAHIQSILAPFADETISPVSAPVGIGNFVIAIGAETRQVSSNPVTYSTIFIRVSSYDPGAYYEVSSGWNGGSFYVNGTAFEASGSYSIPNSSPAVTYRSYGNVFFQSEAAVDNVSFTTTSPVSSPDSVAIHNESEIQVTDIASFGNFRYSIVNKGLEDRYVDASGRPVDWAGWLHPDPSNPLSSLPYEYIVLPLNIDTVLDGSPVSAHAHISFEGTINASQVVNEGRSGYDYTLTLEGLNGTGAMSVSGASYDISPGETVTLKNLTVTSPENTTYAIVNRGTLVIENSYEIEDGSMVSTPTDAYISAEKGTAILNKASLTLINATVKDSVNGIENTGLLYMLNSQILDNSGWALINASSGRSYVLDSSIVFNANGLNATGGTVTLVNSILANSGMGTDGTALTVGGFNYSVGSGATFNYESGGNVVGRASDGVTDSSETAPMNAALLSQMYSKTGGSYLGDDNRLNLKTTSGNPALSGGYYIAVTFDDNGSITSYSYGLDKDALSGIFVETDKDGVSRLPAEGSADITIGATSNGVYVPPGPEPPGPGPGPEPPEPPVPVVYVVNTFADDTDASNALFSLREAFALAEASEASFTVTFDYASLLAEGGNAFVLDGGIGMSKGELHVDFSELSSVLGKEVYITVSGEFNDEALFVFGDGSSGTSVTMSGVSVDGSRASGGVMAVMADAVLSLHDVNVSAGAGFNLGTGRYGGAFLVMGALSISGEGTYTATQEVTRGGLIYSEGRVDVTGNITFKGGRASDMGGFLYQAGEDAVSNIGDENSLITITGMSAPRGVVVAQMHGETNLVNVVIKDNGRMDSGTHRAEAQELIGVTGDVTVVNASIYDNVAEAVFGLYAVDSEDSSKEFLGKTYIVDSSIVHNAAGFAVDSSDDVEYDAGGSGALDYSTALYWAEVSKSYVTNSDGTVTVVYGTSEGDIYLLNSLVGTEVDVDNVSVNVTMVSTLTGEAGMYSFLYNGDGSLQVDGETGVPLLSEDASDGGVIAAVYTDAQGNRALAYRTLDDTAWRGLDGGVLSQFEPNIDSIIRNDAIGEISVSGNGSHRYLAQSNLTYGSYSSAYADTLTATDIVVTTTADEMDGNADISLREAAKYARKLYEQTGTVFTVTFADGLQQQGDVLLDSTLVLDSPVTVDGGSDITVSAGGFLGDSMIRVTGTGITLSNITLNGENNAVYDEDGNLAGVIGAGGILRVENGGSATASGVTFENGVALAGGAVYNEGSLSVTGGAFDGNEALLGGAVYDEGSLTVSGSTFASNTAYDGAAIYGTGSVGVSSSQFTGNTGTRSVVTGNSVSVSGSTFASNTADDSIVSGAGSVSVSGSTFASNEAEVLLAGTSVSASNSTFTGNTAENLLVGSTVSVSGSTFTGNDAAENLLAGSSVSVSGSTFTGNEAENLLAGSSVSVSGSTFKSNTLDETLAKASGNISVSGSTFASNETGILLDGTSVSVSGSTFTENKAAYLADAPGDIRISDSTFTRNTADEALVSGSSRITVSGSRFEDNRATWTILETVGDVTVSGSRFEGNIAENGSIIDAYGAESSVRVENSFFTDNEAADAIVFGSTKIFLDEVSLTDNVASAALQSDGNIAVISTTVADTKGNGTVKVSAGENAYILNSTIASVSADAGALVEGTNVYVTNSILVSNDTADVTSGTLTAAYSVMSTGSGDHVTSSWSYDDAFAGNGVSSDGTLHPVESLASQRGSFTMYSVNADGSLNVAYSDTYADEVISSGNFYDPRTDQSWTALTPNAPVNGTVVRYSYEQYFTMPGIGAYWSGSYSVDYGPGLNTEFANASFNGVFGYFGMNNYALAVSGMSGGIALAGSMLWPVTVSFDPAADATTRSGFRASERGDLGGIPSAGTYITETVGASADELESEYYMTPTTADGLPVAPEQTAEEGVMEPEGLEAKLAEISESIGDGVEKVASLFKHADVFKDDFDKALEELLGIKA